MSHTEEFNRLMALNKPAKKEKKQPAIVKQIKERENMNPLQTSISKCTINGNTVNLPFERLDNYTDVRKALLNAGAKYKNNAFIFPTEAEPYINRLMDSESVNIKKEFQFFATPKKLAETLVAFSGIEDDINASVLEPSAGQGAIINEVLKIKGRTEYVYYCELMDVNRSVLSKIDKTVHLEDDFLNLAICRNHLFDIIIANPPFNKNQDIDHVLKMYKHLKDRGRIVTIMSKHWIDSKNKKETAFREFLEEKEAQIIPIDAGEFKESGTNIATVIVIIDKYKD